MRGACGKCGGTFDGQMLCPNCGVRLEENEDGGASQAPPAFDPAETPDGLSIPRRLAVGLACALGLYHGLKHAASAVLLAGSPEGEITTELLLGVLAVATFLTTVLLGTANRQAEVAGVCFGLVSVVVFLGPDLFAAKLPPLEWLVLLPVGFALTGAVGGYLGRTVVAPAPKLPTFGQFDSRAFAGQKPPRPSMHWPRLVIAAAVVIAGAYWAESIRLTLAKGLAGSAAGLGSAKLVCWMIGAIVALVGGVGAGANTRAGFRQGLAAGACAGTGVLMALSAGGLGSFPVAEFWMDQFDLKDGGWLVYVGLAGSTVLATMIGGCLGSALFPPRRR